MEASRVNNREGISIDGSRALTYQFTLLLTHRFDLSEVRRYPMAASTIPVPRIIGSRRMSLPSIAIDVAPYQRLDGGFGSGARGSFSSRMAA